MSITNVEQLKFYAHKILPLVYDDSLSYYELLCKVVTKLNQVIANDTEQNEAIADLEDEIAVVDAKVTQKYNQAIAYIDSEITRVTTNPSAFASGGTAGKFLGIDAQGHFAWVEGGEPSAYIKNVTVSGNTATFTKKDNTTVVYTPTIPTKTSDLQNDSGFIDKNVNDLANYTKSSNLADVATSGSYNDLDDTPQIHNVISGGQTNQVLAKNSSADYDLKWTNNAGIPAGGTTAQVLAKTSNTDYAVSWIDPSESPIPTERLIPSGGTTGQVLAKDSNDDYDAVWVDEHTVPSGGLTGQVLMKESASDYDANWNDLPYISSLFTITVTQSGGDLVADKTFSQISSAITDGNVIELTYSGKMYNLVDVSVSQFKFATVTTAGVSIIANGIVINDDNTVTSASYTSVNTVVDATPTQSSTNAVQSGGVYTALQNKASKSISFTISLLSSGWTNLSQTIQDVRIVTNGYDYIITPASSSYGEYASSMIYAEDISTDGEITFKCTEAPTNNITVNILKVEVA